MDALFETAALRVSQPIGEYWVAAIPAKILLHVTIPDPLRVMVDSEYDGRNEWQTALRMLGTQRAIEAKRLTEISEYIDTKDATFPNAIILSANSDVGDSDDGKKDWLIRRGAGGDKLIIPKNARRAAVVDGQHRLYAFLKSRAKRDDFILLCSVFFEMPQPLQAMVFATINTNQKAVRRGLALNLYGYNVEDEDRHEWSPEKLAVFIARRLHWDDQSALHDRIKLEAADAPTPEILPGANRAISLAAVVDGVLRLITRDAKRDRTELRSERFFKTKRNKLAPDDAPLRAWYLQSSDHELYSLVRSFADVVDTVFWSQGREGSMLTRAVGVRALFEFYGSRLSQLGLKPAADGRDNPRTISTVKKDVSAALAKADEIDFSDAFFEATGRGQRRIFNALRLASGMLTFDEIDGDDAAEYRRLRIGR